MARPRVTNQLDTACAAYIAGLVPIPRFVLAATGAGKLTSKRPSAPRR